MIPFFEQPVLQLGYVSIHAFGLLVAASMLIGLQLATRRARSQGLDPHTTSDMLSWALPFGIAGAHLFSVVGYFPGRLASDPWLLFWFWEDLSSFGGMIGGYVGIWVYFHVKRRAIPSRLFWAQLDALAFILPFSWAIGRLACFTAHDHPGHLTTFFLGRSLESPAARAFITQVYTAAGRFDQLPIPSRLTEMAFHDLGWYEFLYLLLVATPVFLWLDRTPRGPLFWIASFLLLYAPMRFGLDFLRVSDSRYAGLTPGQYASIGGLLAALWLVRSANRVRKCRSG